MIYELGLGELGVTIVVSVDLSASNAGPVACSWWERTDAEELRGRGRLGILWQAHSR
jgi:hypothetical protein